MQAIKTVFWVILAVLLTVFMAMNFHVVPVYVWPNGSNTNFVEWPLALVVVASFLLGYIPMFLAYRAAKWSSRRKINQQEQTIAQLQSAPTLAPAAVAPVAPAAQPLAASTPDTLL
jgi:lipopolysaccharide assembly protein A